MKLRAPKIENTTCYDGRTVNGIVRWVFRELELDGRDILVKVKHHRGSYAYAGRFYPQAWAHADYIYSHERGDWKEVGPVVPRGVNHLIVCRIAKPGIYPRTVSVYDRRDVPEPWEVEDWREALVSITAHEGQHLRQYRHKPRGKRGRFNETETEWAAFRLWRRWREKPLRARAGASTVTA